MRSNIAQMMGVNSKPYTDALIDGNLEKLEEKITEIKKKEEEKNKMLSGRFGAGGRRRRKLDLEYIDDLDID